MNIVERFERIQELAKQMSDIATELSNEWQMLEVADDFLVEGYPFESSFDEVVCDINRWSDTINDATIEATYKVITSRG